MPNAVRPVLLFENLLEDPNGTLSAGEAPGWPVENALDWSLHTAARWKSDVLTNPTHFGIDLTAAPFWWRAAQAFCIGGWNPDEISANYPSSTIVRLQYSDNGSAWTTTTFASVADRPPLGRPVFAAAGSESAIHRYWRIEIQNALQGATWDVPLQLGIATIGRILELPGAPQSLEWWSRSWQVSHYDNENGDNLGSNLEAIDQRFNLDYSAAGVSRPDFFEAGSGLSFDGDMVPHLEEGKPFWFAFEPVFFQALNTAWLVTLDETRQPFVGIRDLRALLGSLRAYRGVA